MADDDKDRILDRYGPQDEHGFLFSRVGGDLKFNPYEAVKNFMGYRAPPGALSTSGDDTPIRNAADVAGWVGMSGLGLNAFGAVPANALGSAGAKAPQALRAAVPPRVENPIRAYHGSPHDFDKFDLSKIGTGEGAQAYGHGLYFAEHEPVAKKYKETLAAHPAAKWLREWNGDIDVAIEQAKRAKNTTWGRINPEVAKILEDHKAGSPIPDASGRMYEVAIHATPEQFLDWDKPLSQQSEVVRKGVEAAGWSGRDPKYSDARLADLKAAADAAHQKYTDMRTAYFADAWKDPTRSEAAFNNSPEVWRAQNEIHKISNKINDAMREREALTGKGILEALSDSPMFGATYDKATANVSSKLNEAGIPGIRYLDQGSRGAGNGTSNYVVFDPARIEILRKYGLLGPLAGLSTADILQRYGQDDRE